MLLPGVADLETLRYFAGLLGEEEIRELTRTSGAGGATRSVSRRRRPLSAPEALRQLPDRHALLLYGRLAPDARGAADVVRGPATTHPGRWIVNWFPFDEESWEDPERRRSPEDDEADAEDVHRDWSEAEEDEELLSRRSGRWPLDRATSCRASAGCGSSSCGPTRACCASATGCGLRSGWWEDAIQVEAIAALAAWVERYDTGEWDDPPGKLDLLYDLERAAQLLRDGLEPFAPERDRGPFLRHLIESGAAPPPHAGGLG